MRAKIPMRKVPAPAETERALAALWVAVAVAVAEEPVSEAVFELVLEALEEAELLLEAALALELAVPVVLVLRVVELPEAARMVVSKMIFFSCCLRDGGWFSYQWKRCWHQWWCQ